MWGADDCAADTAGWGPLPAGAVSYSFRAARVREETDVISLGLVGLVAVGAGDRVSADQNAQSAGGGERAHPECGRLSPRTDEQSCTGLSRVGGTSLPVLEALSRKFWSGENFGPGDQNSRKIGPPGPLFPENLGPGVE